MKHSALNGSIVRGADGAYRVSGQLVFATVRDVLRASAVEFQMNKPLTIDLSGVASADSAGLALLIEWFCSSQKAKGTIRFMGVPAQLRALAKISEVDSFLPLS